MSEETADGKTNAAISCTGVILVRHDFGRDMASLLLDDHRGSLAHFGFHH
jgi:hypothetical protein